ncbi:MAG: PilZ domain-containing protein [Planctomycetota bacterium]|jgi:hypothetical protein
MTITTRIDPENERRAVPRIQLSRPCKIHDPASGKYHSGRTHDLTERSVMLTIDRPLPLRPGQRISVGIAMLERQGLILGKEMMEATVVRSLQTEDYRTLLAVQFVQAERAIAPERRAAA